MIINALACITYGDCFHMTSLETGEKLLTWFSGSETIAVMTSLIFI